MTVSKKKLKNRKPKQPISEIQSSNFKTSYKYNLFELRGDTLYNISGEVKLAKFSKNTDDKFNIFSEIQKSNPYNSVTKQGIIKEKINTKDGDYTVFLLPSNKRLVFDDKNLSSTESMLSSKVSDEGKDQLTKLDNIKCN